MSQLPANLIQGRHDSKGKAFLVVATVCAIALLSAWATGLIVSPADNWLIRYRFIGSAFAICLGCTYLWTQQIARQQSVAQRYFEALSQVDEAQLAHGTLAADLPAIDPSNPWYTAAQRFTEIFRGHCGRLQQLEHDRSALEVRTKLSLTRQSQVEAIFAALPEAALVVDQANRLVLANPAAQQLLGFEWTEEEQENRDIARIIHNQTLVELISDKRRHKASAQKTIELELTDQHGATRCYGVTLRALFIDEQRGQRNPRDSWHLRDGASAARSLLVVLRDLNQLKASQKRNAEFVSAVSHEMKTPLAGIKAYVELLADGDADDDQTREEFLEIINGQANRLQRLIENLLNLARIEAGVVHVSKEAMSLSELLQEALELVRPAAEAKSIELTGDLSQLYTGVLIDRDMLMQAAINLLSNAIKYTPENGSVTLRSRLVDNQAVFEVSDSGVGLSEEDQVLIFEKFYRVKKDREMAAGTGLGLPLAKHIVEDVHGGRLTVESQLGQGSTFRVALPVAAQMLCHA